MRHRFAPTLTGSRNNATIDCNAIYDANEFAALVELSGIEPLTSSLRTTRSTN
jgi:hypothetical protein